MIAYFGYVNSEKRKKTEENCGNLSGMYWLYIAACLAVYQIQRDTCLHTVADCFGKSTQGMLV